MTNGLIKQIHHDGWSIAVNNNIKFKGDSIPSPLFMKYDASNRGLTISISHNRSKSINA